MYSIVMKWVEDKKEVWRKSTSYLFSLVLKLVKHCSSYHLEVTMVRI